MWILTGKSNRLLLKQDLLKLKRKIICFNKSKEVVSHMKTNYSKLTTYVINTYILMLYKPPS